MLERHLRDLANITVMLSSHNYSYASLLFNANSMLKYGTCCILLLAVMLSLWSMSWSFKVVYSFWCLKYWQGQSDKAKVRPCALTLAVSLLPAMTSAQPVALELSAEPGPDVTPAGQKRMREHKMHRRAGAEAYSWSKIWWTSTAHFAAT